VEHTCEASAGSQKPQSNLGVFQLTQSIKQVTSFGGPFHRVRMDEAIFTDGSPQELKVAGDAAASISVGAEQSIRKMAMEGRNVQATNSNQLRFGEVQAEPNVGGSRFNQAKDSTEGVEVASKDPVIQVVHSDVQPCIAKAAAKGAAQEDRLVGPRCRIQQPSHQIAAWSAAGKTKLPTAPELEKGPEWQKERHRDSQC
jgi:hypothetical protein